MNADLFTAEAPFDLAGPLPSGVTVLEASAGTGKTYTIAALTARFVAEGIGLESLLLVTFTRMATGELRERVRERLVATEIELGRVLAGAALPLGADEVVILLADGPQAEVERRRERLAAAIAGFDAATIATTHSFCQEVLAELGTLGDLEPDVRFVEDISDLEREVVDDLYVRRFWQSGGAPFSRTEAGRIAELAIANPVAPVYPSPPAHPPAPGAAGIDDVAAMRGRLARAVRVELEARKRALGVMTYDDLLTRLQATLTGPNGPAAAARLRARYRVVLIDEFQDTDPTQWEIVETAFGSGDTTLVLIADPKQAIYAFRGADVYAYLAAVGAASARATLTVNRRSDQPLLHAFDALFGNARLGHPGIVYRRVEAAPAHRRPRLHGAPVPAAMRVRIVDRTQQSVELTGNGWANAQSARAHIARDLAADVVALLSSHAEIEGHGPVVPGDIAVLVRTHANAALVQRELDAAGVPAVINGAGSVFGTAAAGHWLSVLHALERPASPPRARAAALTPLLGWTAAEVGCAGEEELEELHRTLHAWARLLREHGVASLAQAITLDRHVPGRMLQTLAGERELTDLQHIAELLHVAASGEQLGTAALATWLQQRIAAAGREGTDELARRLESDADAVQVLTIHRSKGLEFPITYCPFLWESIRARRSEPVCFHDPDAADQRAIDVALDGPDFRRHFEQYVAEDRGEALRLAYVALTRAKHQCVIWWAGAFWAKESPLSRLLFAMDADGNVAGVARNTPSDQAAFDRFTEIAGAAGGAVSVEWSRLGAPAFWGGADTAGGELAVARFDRRLDTGWRRTSYSDITAAAHDAWVASEPEEAVVVDEPSGPAAMPAAGRDALPLGEMPTGARVGTVIHLVLEAVEFDAPDLVGALEAELAGVEAGDPESVARGLAAAIATPFAGGGVRLRGLARADRLDELAFEWPLAGGDEAERTVELQRIAQLLREALHPADPLAGYAQRVADPLLRSDVRGYLTGSIDLVLRVDGRFAIVDYKTNWLGGADGQLTAWHYRPAALAAEMQSAHYALQALLYLVALHRYLRWRLPGYDADRHLAGVHYLFLRGMVGDDGSGVFSWQPPSGLIPALSDVLDGR